MHLGFNDDKMGENLLAESYLSAGNPVEAIPILERSLDITGDKVHSNEALFLIANAYKLLNIRNRVF